MQTGGMARTHLASTSLSSSSSASRAWGPARQRDSDVDRWLADDPPPPWRRAHPWACVAVLGVAAVVVVLLVVAAAAWMTPPTMITAAAPRYDADGAVGAVGLLLTGTPLDADLRGASQLAARHSDASGVPLLESAAATTTEAVAAAFEELWRAGVRVFLTGGDAAQTEALCRSVRQAGREALLVAPAADAASPSCGVGGGLLVVSLAPPPAALLAAEVAAMAQGGLDRLLPVLAEPTQGSAWAAPLVPLLTAAAAQRNVSVAAPVYLDAAHPSAPRLQQALAALPGAAVWLAAGRHLPQLMAKVGSALQGRLVMLHAHPAHLAALLEHPAARATTEACAATTVQWAGPSTPDAPAHRRLLVSLSPADPLAAALAYHAAALASQAAALGGAANLTQLAATLLGEEGGWGAAPAQGHVRPTAAWAARLRLVERPLLGKVVMQDSPWLLEGLSRVEEEEGEAAGSSSSSWRVSSGHAPARLLAREEVWQLAEHAGCGALARVEVKAHDPLTHRRVLASWPAHAAPDALLVPNASPRGFSVTASCRAHGGREVEVACRGAAAHNESLSCVVAEASSGRQRREVSNVLFPHGILDLTSPNGKDTDPFIILRKVKGLFKNADFLPFLAQIGGCLGSVAGCSFCFIFILSRNVSVTPGVCMGPCGVGVSGACISLFAKGIEYKKGNVEYKMVPETVICTELFTQGQLSWESYIADAAYGTRLAGKDPQALRGYQLLAGPLVAAMQLSPTLTGLVKTLARPWISHMEYEEGMAAFDNPLGHLITTLGLPLCSAAALLHDHFLVVTGLLALTAAITRLTRK
ncbi:uncharacterized protein LOC126983320 isoform X2 [Eriocheir sinensis]|uniref:uncharacterized protein LOC126983320 isoform X2 n=1 Tax=Eriocheir sinensis TaxID=95602 RepID=UPI0021C77C71|nr:uncharacterized protein LOC126983320 isoform X2 [Eriocheir sinensis]